VWRNSAARENRFAYMRECVFNKLEHGADLADQKRERPL